MKLLIQLTLGAACALGSIGTAQAQAARPAAAAAKPAAGTKELDLTAQGAPIIIRVPTGVTATKGEMGTVELRGPEFMLGLMGMTGGADKAKQWMDMARKAIISEGAKEGLTLVPGTNPLAVRAHNKDPKKNDMWLAAVVCPANGKFYTIEQLRKDGKDIPVSPASLQAMYDAATSARPTGK